MSRGRRQQTMFLVALALVLASAVVLVRPSLAADGSELSKEQIEQFLLNAQVIKSKQSSKGITAPLHLTLSDGKITHDASFETVDVHKRQGGTGGRIEFNFVDSYKYNVAAYRVAELLGLDDMVPVYVERTWQGRTGSLSWWLPVQMDEAERVQKHISPPDADAWNKSVYKIRVLDQLVYDTDANLSNIVITDDWKVWRIDFSRAFRLQHDLLMPKELTHCDRQLFSKLKALDGNQLAARTKGFLTPGEVAAVMARRDKIVGHFQQLIAQKGEDAVLY